MPRNKNRKTGTLEYRKRMWAAEEKKLSWQETDDDGRRMEKEGRI